jgi:NAD(P)-dependent dehydrogenase (short-subunit alcohol dehydrogenase family)
VPGDLAGKVALVTGVGRVGQIGHAVAAALGAAGAALVIADRDATSVGERAAELTAAGITVRPTVGDLTRPEAARAAVDLARRELGGLDTVVNIAGGLTTFGPFGDITPDALDRELAINLRTTWFVCQAALPALVARGGGAIVNFASVAVVRPAAHLAAYIAAKAAVAGLTQALAREFRDQGVRVNAVAPATVRTRDNVAQMGAQPDTPYVEMDDIVRAVRFLASDAAGGITGQILPVTGKAL